jgi:hypothetical protein
VNDSYRFGPIMGPEFRQKQRVVLDWAFAISHMKIALDAPEAFDAIDRLGSVTAWRTRHAGKALAEPAAAEFRSFHASTPPCRNRQSRAFSAAACQPD